MHVKEILDGPSKDNDIVVEIATKHWSSIVGALIALCSSIFVFILFGFHTYIVHKALTTYE